VTSSHRGARARVCLAAHRGAPAGPVSRREAVMQASPRISASDRARTRAAASSSQRSGKPVKARRQISATTAAFVVGDDEFRPEHGGARIGEPVRSPRRPVTANGHPPSLTSPADADRFHGLVVKKLNSRAAPSSAVSSAALGVQQVVRSCPAPPASADRRGKRVRVSMVEAAPGWSGSPKARGPL